MSEMEGVNNLNMKIVCVVMYIRIFQFILNMKENLIFQKEKMVKKSKSCQFLMRLNNYRFLFFLLIQNYREFKQINFFEQRIKINCKNVFLNYMLIVIVKRVSC